MKILVTGANGYLGAGIVKSILDLGHKVVATDYSIDRVDERADRIACDLFSVTDPYKYFNKPDCVLHLAWRDGFVHFSNAHIDDLPKHKEFIDRITQSNISSLSVMGTMHEIGFYEGCIDEKTPCNPRSFYGIAKNALRDITSILCAQNHKNYKWLRAYYIIGDSEFGTSIFSKIVQSVNHGKKDFPFTSGKNEYDFLKYEEFCKLVALATVQNNVSGIINICSGKPERLSDVVEQFIEEHEFDIKLKYGAYPDREYDSRAVWGNNEKIRKIIEDTLK